MLMMSEQNHYPMYHIVIAFLFCTPIYSDKSCRKTPAAIKPLRFDELSRSNRFFSNHRFMITYTIEILIGGLNNIR